MACPSERYAFAPQDEGYLAFLGRISPEKQAGPRHRDRAAGRGCRCKIAAKVDPADQEYFDRVIAPLLDDPLVEFLGEIGDADKSAFLGGALALLFPIDWPEPFGLVMIEAMACGTPVIARPCGSVPEVVRRRPHAASSADTLRGAGRGGETDGRDRPRRVPAPRRGSASRVARMVDGLRARCTVGSAPERRAA